MTVAANDTKGVLPTVAELSPLIVWALKRLGGEAALQEIHEVVVPKLKLTSEQLSLPHVEGKSRSELDYRMAWARTKLKNQGLIERVGSGIWQLAGSERA